MKTTRKMLTVVMMVAALGLVVTAANGATISQNFEGETLGSTTPPAGWSLVPVAGTSSYVVTAGNGGGLAGEATGNHPSNGSTIPAGYVVNSGGVAFDTTQPISGSFDFYIPEAGNYSSALFMVGDIQTGISQTAAGEWLGMFLRERTFGARARLTAGDGSTLFNGDGNNQYRIDTNQWINAEFTWTPTAGTTGDFTFSWTYPSQPNRGPMTATAYTFDSQEAWFGFGSGGYFSGDHSGRFDNISIDGTEISTDGFLHIIKFLDADGDGVRDPNEPILPTGMFTFLIRDAAGQPIGEFPNCQPDIPLPPGIYTAEEIGLTGDWYPTSPNPLSFEIVGGEPLELEFGNAVPEPATMALLGLAACGLGGYVRRRRKT